MRTIRVSLNLYSLLFKLNGRHDNAIISNLIQDAIWQHSNVPTTGTTDQSLIDYLDISQNDPQMISYCLTSKLPALATAGEVWNPKKRYHGKPAKTLRKIFGDQFTSDQYTEFASLYFKGLTPDVPDALTFSIVDGKELLRCYNEENYLPHDLATTDELHNSCMRHAHENHFMELYASNPNEVKLAVLLNQHKQVCARSLVWYGLRINGVTSEVPCYDRIYHTSREVEALMERNMQTFTSIYRTSNRLSIYLPNYEQDYYPFIDTLRYSDDDGNFSNRDGDVYTYDCTNGERTGDECQTCCEGCGCSVSEDDARYCDCGTYCSDCAAYVPSRDADYPNEYVQYCASRNEYYHRNDVTEINGEYYPDEDCTTTTNGDGILSEDAIYTEDGNVYAPDDENTYFVYVNGTTYDIDSSDITQDHKGDYILSSEAFVYDGVTYHESDCLTTYDGDTFPEVLTALYVKIDGVTRTAQMSLF